MPANTFETILNQSLHTDQLRNKLSESKENELPILISNVFAHLYNIQNAYKTQELETYTYENYNEAKQRLDPIELELNNIYGPSFIDLLKSFNQDQTDLETFIMSYLGILKALESGISLEMEYSRISESLNASKENIYNGYLRNNNIHAPFHFWNSNMDRVTNLYYAKDAEYQKLYAEYKKLNFIEKILMDRNLANKRDQFRGIKDAYDKQNKIYEGLPKLYDIKELSSLEFLKNYNEVYPQVFLSRETLAQKLLPILNNRFLKIYADLSISYSQKDLSTSPEVFPQNLDRLCANVLSKYTSNLIETTENIPEEAVQLIKDFNVQFYVSEDLPGVADFDTLKNNFNRIKEQYKDKKEFSFSLDVVETFITFLSDESTQNFGKIIDFIKSSGSKVGAMKNGKVFLDISSKLLDNSKLFNVSDNPYASDVSMDVKTFENLFKWGYEIKISKLFTIDINSLRLDLMGFILADQQAENLLGENIEIAKELVNRSTFKDFMDHWTEDSRNFADYQTKKLTRFTTSNPIIFSSVMLFGLSYGQSDALLQWLNNYHELNTLINNGNSLNLNLQPIIDILKAGETNSEKMKMEMGNLIFNLLSFLDSNLESQTMFLMHYYCILLEKSLDEQELSRIIDDFAGKANNLHEDKRFDLIKSLIRINELVSNRTHFSKKALSILSKLVIKLLAKGVETNQEKLTFEKQDLESVQIKLIPVLIRSLSDSESWDEQTKDNIALILGCNKENFKEIGNFIEKLYSESTVPVLTKESLMNISKIAVNSELASFICLLKADYSLHTNNINLPDYQRLETILKYKDLIIDKLKKIKKYFPKYHYTVAFNFWIDIEGQDEKNYIPFEFSPVTGLILDRNDGDFFFYLSKVKTEDPDLYKEISLLLIGKVFNSNGSSLSVNFSGTESFKYYTASLDKIAQLQEEINSLDDTIEKIRTSKNTKDEDFEEIRKLRSEKAIVENKLDKYIRFSHSSQVLKMAVENSDLYIYLMKSKLERIILLQNNLLLSNDLMSNVGKSFSSKENIDFLTSPTLPILMDEEIQSDLEKVNSDADLLTLPKKYWLILIQIYIIVDANASIYINEFHKKIHKLFESTKIKTMVFEEFYKVWIGNLTNNLEGSEKKIIDLLAAKINDYGGVGVLKYIDQICSYYESFNKVSAEKITADVTKDELTSKLLGVERAFTQYNIDNEDRYLFYSVSKEVMEISPSLLVSLYDLISKFASNPSELKSFFKDIYPIFLSKITLMQVQEDLNPRNLVKLRNSFRSFTIDDRDNLVDEVKNLFITTFGIKKFPDNFTPEMLRIIKDMSIYLANINNRDEGKQMQISIYMAMLINGKWEQFRAGLITDLSEYFSENKLPQINAFLKSKNEQVLIDFSVLGVNPDKLSQFKTKLQMDETKLRHQNVQTIDVKLGNLSSNLIELLDPDIYQDQLEKEIIIFFSKSNVDIAKVNETLAKLVRSNLSQEDEVVDNIKLFFKSNRLEYSVENIKLMQKKLKILGTIIRTVHYLQDNQVSERIAELQALLQPSMELITIFNRVGEDFAPHSGALALSEDLSYLENLIVKQKENLTQPELDQIEKYLGSIRQSLVGLEKTYSELTSKVTNLIKSTDAEENQLLKARMDGLKGIISVSDKAEIVQVSMTGNIINVIENIRACLGCKTKEVNNDTNLNFGDENKFLILTSPAEGQRSYADQIVYLAPVKINEEVQYAFVMDNIYGVKSSDILMSHIEIIKQKIAKLKKEFPDLKISIFVTDAAISSSGASKELLSEKLGTTGNTVVDITGEVDIKPSITGDPYLEFGGGVRDSGKRNVKGLKVN